MTDDFFNSIAHDSPSDRDVDAVELRPRLTARRESPPRIRMALEGPGALSSASPRATARHFAARRGVPAVRSFRTPDIHRRKVIVTARKVLTPQGARRLLLRHVAYIQRGVAEVGDRENVFFDACDDQANPRSFVERCQGDRQHYRLVINPEDGTELGDLKSFGRQLMSGVEEDLGGNLDWIAGAHFDTGRPHLHIMVRGRHSDGRSLRAPGAYLASGLRERARDVATEILGPRAERVPNRTIQADRLTPVDCVILRAAKQGRIETGQIPQAYRPDSLRRLIHLEHRGLAVPVAHGAWRLPHDLRQTLLKLGQLHARETAAAKVLQNSGLNDQRARLQALSPEPGERFVGAFVGLHRTGRYSQGAHAVVLDLADGRLGHFQLRDAKSAMCLDRIREGAVIQVAGFPRSDRDADRTIAEVAAARGGIWSTADHAAARPGDWPRFIAFHEKRLAAMSAAGACTSLADGRFGVPADYLERARQADAAQWGVADVRLRVLDHRLLDEQVRAIGLTWLDRLLTGQGQTGLSGPFGGTVEAALQERITRLRMTGLGSGDPLVLSEADIQRLTNLEIKSVFEALGQDGKAVFMSPSGQRTTGTYNGRIHIAGVPFAVLEDRSAINLVPWSPGMENCRGQVITAIAQGGNVEFHPVRGLARDLGLG